MEGKYRDRMGYLGELERFGIISKVVRLLRDSGYYVANDGSGKIRCELHMAWDYSWHHVAHLEELDCHLWHRIMFDIMGFLPTKCLACFKVVVKPRTLRQLFSLLDLQLSFGLPSKCGTEDRPEVFGNYGGYFYNRGLDAGLVCYRKVRDAVAADPDLRSLLDDRDVNGVPTRVILKRACTEFERRFGRSDKWGNPSDDQAELERRIEDAFYRDYPKVLQSRDVVEHVHEGWIRFAWDRGDETAKDYNGGLPLYPPYVTYHHLEEGVIGVVKEGKVTL